jgi:mannonate dehydratase
MKLGFGLYRHMLDREHFRFARQCGATHLIIHLVDYFSGQGNNDQPVSSGMGGGWGKAGEPGRLWTVDELLRIRKLAREEGLVLHGIENFDPAHWHDVLLDGPSKEFQMEGLKAMIRALGEAGISVMGYNFSLAGVYGRKAGNWARGKAGSVGMNGLVDNSPMPDGMVWNMELSHPVPGTSLRARISAEQLWARVEWFLKELLPVAEDAGVVLAAHPDDPPVPRLRDTPRLVYKPHLFKKLVELVPSPSNKLEFCLGSIAEMTDGDVYHTTETHAAEGNIAYIHFRNVVGKVPFYREVFPDEGDIDMRRIIKILQRNEFQGVLIPDHAPRMSCPAPWHAGMAYSMGFLRGLMPDD